MADMTDNARIFQYWEEHWQEFMDLWNARVKDAADVELVPFDDERHVGCLMVYQWQGVKKVVSVTPETLIEGLAKLNEDLRERCTRAAESAEDAAELAGNKAAFAEDQGNRVERLINQINELSELVRTQGEVAEQQGAACEAQMNEVKAWYQPFKKAAEDWYLPFKSNAETWLSEKVHQWNAFWAAASDAFEQWTTAENDREAKEVIRKQNEAVRCDNESERQAAERLRDTAEQQRIIHEEVRLDGTFRQNANTGNWERLDQRTNEWEDTGNSWQGGLLAYRFYTDWSSGRIHVVKNSLDKVNFSIRKGRLVATYNN